VAAAGDRRVILLSHHQPISLLERQGPRLVARLSGLLAARRIFAWYWGHEHRLLLYDRHPQWNMYGRCIGHGGFPYFRDDVAPVPAEPGFHRLETKNYVPGGEILLGANPYIEGHEKEYGPHGFLRLEFNGPDLNEVICDAEGRVLRERELT
jgi:hypothetical protein